MNEKRELYPINYSENLSVINNLNFTPREIDVMACLLSARGTSKIAAFLSIAPKTVVNHIQHIMQKIGCNSREGIIDFIERSNNQNLLRVHYSQLLLQSSFKKSLKKIAKLFYEPLGCSFVYWKDTGNDHLLLKNLKADLELVGLNVLLEPIEKDNLITSLSESSPTEHYSIYVMSKHFRDIETLTHSEGLSITKNASDKSHFLFIEKADFQEIPNNFSDAKCIDCTDSKNYYFIVFNILKSLLHDINLDEIIQEFTQQYEVTNGSSEGIKHQEAINEQKQIYSLPLSKQWIKEKKWFFLAGLIALICVTGFVLLNDKKAEKGPSIRSDLIIPHHNVLLNRPEIIAELEKYLVGKDGIKTVALVGTGGAGKTTLARQYAHEKKENIIWEINAETQETLKGAFEKLAQQLAKTEEDQKTLRALLEEKNPIKREEKILSFVKDHLRTRPNWFLIFDNVEKFSNIQNYFPLDSNIWGNGKIILTTRDSNIENNNHINKIIFIGELSQDQKLNLFMKIMCHENTSPLAPIQSQEMKKFLEKIPPYPLDISIAAYYIKATGVPHEKYLERLNTNDENFLSTQENLIKESGDYTKTRYSIITLSLHQLIKAHKDFADLLLFISLIDSQNIPINLLEKYKNPSVVDSFIYHLKKFSLMRADAYHATHTIPTFSIHRSTQEISLTYLIKTLALEKGNPTIKDLTQTLEVYINEVLENQDLQTMKTLIYHCVMYLNHQSLLTETSRGIIESKLGRFYALEHNPDKAKPLLEKALVDLNKSNIENSSRIAECLVYLGSVFYGLGDFEKAKILIEQGLNVYKMDSSQRSPGFALALRCLGLTVSALGDYKKAKDLKEQSLLIYKRNYPESHNRVAEALSSLGFSYYTLGYYEKSKEILEKSIPIYKRNSPNNFRFGESLIVLGNIYMKKGEYGKAKELLDNSLNSLLRILPRDHCTVMWAVRSLGSAHQGLGNYKEAKKLLEESVLAYEKHYGKNHTETSEFLLGLGELYLAEEDFEKAEALMKKSLNIFQENKHPLSYACLESLAELYLKKSLLEKNKMDLQQSKNFQVQAIDYLKQALEAVTTHFSVDSPHRDRIQLKLKNLEES